MEKTPAILLRKTPWSETSLIVHWLTEHFGSVRTVARGARKPGSALAGKLDIFFRAEISFSQNRKGGDLHALGEVSLLSAFDAAQAGYGGMYLAAYFSELCGIVAPSMHPAPEVFNLLTRGIDYLQKGRADRRALDHFEKELCRALGVYDVSGRVGTAQALASLCGGVPRSRAAALRFLP